MMVKQNLSILFFHSKKKARKADGKAPIYVRVTIDGMYDEISSGIVVHPDNWNKENKIVCNDDPDYKKLNKQLRQIETDLERHFDLVQATNEVATPELVFESYRTPLNGEKQRLEKIENLQLDQNLDLQITKFLDYHKKRQKAFDTSLPISPERNFLLQQEQETLTNEIAQFAKKAKEIFENKKHIKTLILTVNEHLLNFLELASASHRSPNTLEKMLGRKKRIIEFLQFHSNVIDIELSALRFNFMDKYYKFNLVQKKLQPNSAMKHCQCVKEIIDRAVANEWMNTNIFSIFHCTYIDPNHDWLTWEEMQKLIGWKFDQDKLNEIRDIIIFCSFTGLSYLEVYTFSPADIINGIDGERWINKNRQKTDGSECLPLLPIAKDIIEKYKSHPKCIQKGRLLPVPTNQEFNRCCKEIAKQTGISISMRTHKNRYFFANEVTYNQGVPLKTVSSMLGHKQLKTTEIYVRPNKRNISENMAKVQTKLFDNNGELKTSHPYLEHQGAKVVSIATIKKSV